MLTWGPALLLWAACLYKLPTLVRDRRDSALRSYWSAIGWLAAAMTVLVPQIALTLDQLIGVPNLSWLLVYAGILLAGFSATVALLHDEGTSASLRARAHQRRRAVTAIIVVLSVLFALAETPVETQDFVSSYAVLPAGAALLTVFYAGLTFVCLDMIPISLRAANRDTGLLRLGLRGIVLAAGVTLIYLAYNQVTVLQLLAGHRQDVWGDPITVSRWLAFASTGLIAVASSVPDWGARLRGELLLTWWSQYRVRRQMFRLWFDLCSCVPSLSLQLRSRPVGNRAQATIRDLLVVRKAHFHLHRRVIEITDGRLALRPFGDLAAARTLLADAGVSTAAPGAPALTQAATLVVGIRAKRAGEPTTISAAQPAAAGAVNDPSVVAADTNDHAEDVLDLDAYDLDREVANLAQVASAYRQLARRPRIRSLRPRRRPSARPAASTHA